MEVGLGQRRGTEKIKILMAFGCPAFGMAGDTDPQKHQFENPNAGTKWILGGVHFWAAANQNPINTCRNWKSRDWTQNDFGIPKATKQPQYPTVRI